MQDTTNTQKFTPQRVREFKQFANSGNVYERLVNSFAPSIWELNDVKRGILCLLLGGSAGSTSGVSKDSDNVDSAEDIERDENNDTINIMPVDEVNEPWEVQDVEALGLVDLKPKGGEKLQKNKQDASAPKMHKRSDVNILLCGDPGTCGIYISYR